MMFRNIRVESVGFRQVDHAGRESPLLFNVVIKHTGWDLWWKKRRREEGGHELSTGLDGGEEEGMSVSW